MSPRNKVKILYVSHSVFKNGAEMCLLTLLKRLHGNRVEAVVVLPGDGPLKEAIEELGIKTYTAPLERWIRFPQDFGLDESDIKSRVEFLHKIIAIEKPELIHTNTSVVLEGALAAKATGIPHIWHLHEILDGHPSLSPLLPLHLVYWLIGKLSARVILVSESFRSSFLAAIPEEKQVVIHNGIEPDIFSPEAASSIRQEFGLADDQFLAVTVGSLVGYKDHGNLLLAAAHVKKRGGQVHFLVAGGGSPEAVAQLQAEIYRLELVDCVHYLGHREDIPQVLGGADFLVLPSRREAFPLAVLEAMAASKPVVATDCGGTSEMIEDGVSGFIVPVGDPPALGEAVLKLTADRKLLLEMGNRARQKLECNYTADTYSEKVYELYLTLLSASHNAPAMWSEAENRQLENCLATIESLSWRLKEYGDLYWKLKLSQSQIEEKDRFIDLLTNSWSWRLTSPMRRIKSLFNK